MCTSLTINFYFIVRKKPLIRQISAPKSIMDHTSPKTTQTNTPVSGAYYTPEQGKVIWCLNN